MYFYSYCQNKVKQCGKSGNLAIELNQEFNTDENKTVIFCMYSGTLCINRFLQGL